ncbi:hypothetical protein G6734_07725 [Polynucleobacter paneuropaeus]|nr:hypothetical protein [Polynucleobacter paneuropaeus]
MDLLNQIFYFSAFIILMGLMLGFVSQRDEYKETEKIWYWPAGLLFNPSDRHDGLAANVLSRSYQDCDQAMYQAKTAGRNQCVVSK